MLIYIEDESVKPSHLLTQLCGSMRTSLEGYCDSKSITWRRCCMFSGWTKSYKCFYLNLNFLWMLLTGTCS